MSKCLQTLGRVSQAKFPKDNPSTLRLFKRAIPDKRVAASLLQTPRMRDGLEAMLWETGANSTGTGIPESLSPLLPSLQSLDSPYGKSEIRELVGFLRISKIREWSRKRFRFQFCSWVEHRRQDTGPCRRTDYAFPMGQPPSCECPVSTQPRTFSAGMLKRKKNPFSRPLGLFRPFLQGLQPNL